MKFAGTFSRRRGRALVAFAVASTVVAGVSVALSPSAVATPGPIQQRTATGVTADPLPTVQIDGIVWSQAVVGNTVYAGGKFANARPAGAASGTNLTPRGNLLSYDITTGTLNTSFAPTLNAQVLAVAASPDGKRVYVGGDFTTANGVNRYRIAAYDTTTGALITSFAPALNSEVKAIVATNTTVYVAGTFSVANSVSRTRLAAFNASNGGLLPWAPTADSNVNAIALSPDGTRITIGGAFANVNSSPAYGLAMLDPTSGALYPFAAASVIQNAGSAAAILSLSISSDGKQLYGTGYVFGAGGNFEGTFAADPDTGALIWMEDCHGDTYGAFGVNGVTYVVSHEHFCSNIGAFPDTNPRNAWYRSTAFTSNVTGTLSPNSEGGYADFGGQPSPSQLNWYPNLAIGNVSGAGQAAWSVTGNSSYVVEGGEFPSVNGTSQQGLVRFAVPSIAPNKSGPQVGGANFTPNLLVRSNSSVRVSWQTNWDRDDENLTYNVYRSDKGSTPVYTTTYTSQFWNRPTIGFLDTGLTAGKTYSYYLKVSDPSGNTAAGGSVSVTVPVNYTQSAYAQDVLSDGASSYWRLDETSGTTGVDQASYNNLTEGSAVTEGAAGAVIGDSDTAATFDGSANGTAGSTSSLVGPNTFTEEAWIKTTTTSGGKIIGFGDSQLGTSSNYDRQVYMDNSGHILFGVYDNGTQTISANGTYNDGQWHQIVATLSPTGMVLYVDGSRASVNPGVTVGQPFTGYWRVGGDNVGSWPSQPSSNFFNGVIDEVAVYPTALNATQVRQHYTDSGRVSTVPTAPTDTYGKAVYADDPELYWRLDDASGPTAADSSANGETGVYSGGVSYRAPSTVTPSGTGIALDGSSGTVGSSQQYSNPTTYSEEAWFNTTTTHGGKIIGFGNAQSGNSSSYDRHVYLQNNGQLVFGTYTGQLNLATSPASYNDGKWHQVVATQGSDGMNLYVDGVLVATNPQTQAQAYSGYWRVGGDSDWGGDSAYLNGSVDEISVYLHELSSADVLAQYKASSAAATTNKKPTAAFTSSAASLTANFDGTGSTDSDGTIAAYSWNFGDGSAASTLATPAHTYGAAGSYSVTLTVTDDQGATDSVTHQVTVTAPPNVAPTAAFTSSASNRAVSVDGTGSSDSDGTVASYSWDFGDGSPAVSGATPSHTYASDGSFTITLTVTDNQGGTGSVTHSVTVAANKAPTAAFTQSCTNLACAFDGSGSTDSDGTIASYRWDFGDGTTPGTGAKPSHTFAAGGTYNVTLTVTDNQGATGSSTVTVTVAAPANQKPVASFTSSAVNLSVSFDGSKSSDSDGTVSSYAWNFGDGSTSTGASPSHTYGAAGSYTVTLTVTDNQGATGSTSSTVTLSPVTTYATDTFGRTATKGWGTAGVGGAWTIATSSSLFSVDGSAGKVNLNAAGIGVTASLASVSATNTNTVFDSSLSAAATGGGVYLALAQRHSGTSEYRLKVRYMPGGVVHLVLTKLVSGTETALKEVAITGLTYTVGDVLRTRFVVSGNGTSTTLTGSVWKVGSTEPASPQVSLTDSTAGLQGAGSIAFEPYLSGTSTTVPVVASFDNLSVVGA